MTPQHPQTSAPAPGSRPSSARRRGCGCGLGGLLVLAIAGLLAWWVVQPGLFVIQPIGALPQGVTLVYRGRPAETPLVLSPDGLCLETMGEVSLLCRMAGIAAAGELTDRVLLRLPYNHSLYLLSTGGREFDR